VWTFSTAVVHCAMVKAAADITKNKSFEEYVDPKA
jgi:hypothetical protein